MPSAVGDSVRVGVSFELRRMRVLFDFGIGSLRPLISGEQEGLGIWGPLRNNARIVEDGLTLCVVRFCRNEHAFVQRGFLVKENTHRE